MLFIKEIKTPIALFVLLIISLSMCANEKPHINGRHMMESNSNRMYMMNMNENSLRVMNSQLQGMDRDIKIMSLTLNELERVKYPKTKKRLWKNHKVQMSEHMEHMQSMMGMMKEMLGQEPPESQEYMKEMRMMMGKMQTMVGEAGLMIDKKFKMCIE